MIISLTPTDTLPVPVTSPKIKGSVAPIVATEKTGNKKLGDCSVTHASQHSCPTSCPWFNAGCYAEQGGPQGIISRRLNACSVTDPVSIARAEAQGIRSLSGTRPLRLHIVGDAKTKEAVQILAAAATEYQAIAGMPVWTYTHGDTERADWGSISVLRSVETLEGAKVVHARGFASAMVVSEFEKDTAYDLGDGFKGIPCPEQTGKSASCRDCQLCTRDAKLHAAKCVILFAAHGNKKNSMGKRTLLPMAS